MSKTVQIDRELFFDLVRVLILDEDSTDVLERTRRGLNDKIDAMMRREYYSNYKDANLTAEEREEARQKYLDAVGMHPSFRW